MTTWLALILGAGAVGGGIGGRLQQAGGQVVLVARGDHLRTLRANGLRLRTPEEDVTLPVTAIAGPDEVDLRADDVLVLATKTQQAAELLRDWADVPVDGGGTAGERLPILLATNGVACEDLALRYFARVYGVCVWMWTAHLVPGEIVLEGVPVTGVFHIGRVPADREGPDELLQRVREEWNQARLKTVLPAEVMPWKYRKLLTNAGNAFQALLGQPKGMAGWCGRPRPRVGACSTRRGSATPQTRRRPRPGPTASRCGRYPGWRACSAAPPGSR